MHSRYNTHSMPDQMDFSSVFMQATTTDQVSSMQMLDESDYAPTMNESLQKQALTENRNLSSIITQIRDEGSAMPPPKKAVRWNRKQTQEKPVQVIPPAGTARVKNIYEQNTRPDALNTEKLTPPDSSEFSLEADMPIFKNSEKAVPDKKQGRWQPLVLSLALAVTAVMGFNLYQLNQQASELRVVLDSYEEQIDELNTTQQKSSDTMSTVSGLKHELINLKQELHTIKSEYAEFDSRLAQSSINDREAPQKEIATVKQDVSELESGLANTRNEMKAIKAAIAKVEGSQAVRQDPVAAEAGWVVNLASLSSKEQAQIGVTMLEKSGRLPVVKETVVNGATVYRLSVEGFSSRNEAVKFIDKARKQYGFEGGWVWQGESS